MEIVGSIAILSNLAPSCRHFLPAVLFGVVVFPKSLFLGTLLGVTEFPGLPASDGNLLSLLKANPRDFVTGLALLLIVLPPRLRSLGALGVVGTWEY